MNPAGYGYFRLEGKTELAHRVAWDLERGPIPAGMCVLHRCDNRRCVAVDHLWLGTQAENNADMRAKGRQVLNLNRPGHRPRPSPGEANGQAKLTWPLVAELREAHGLAEKAGRRLKSGQMEILERRFGVDRTTIRRIVKRKTWK